MSPPAASLAMDAAEIHVPAMQRVVPLVSRYALSAAGPLCISGAHFLAALIFLRTFSRAEFGLVSFLLVIVPFCQSLCTALIGASVSISNARPQGFKPGELETHLKVNLAYTAFVTLAIAGLSRTNGADWGRALVFGLYGGSMCLRWFGRNLAYARQLVARVLVSDLLYGATLLALLLGLALSHALTPLRGAEALLAASLLAILAFGQRFLREQLWLTRAGSLGAYATIWRDLGRWSVAGVALTEFTVNAHAYLVTFLAGPAAFAPLAVGALLMRPVQLVLTAVPDRERPVIARQLAVGDRAAARRSVNHFRIAAGAVWLATVSLSAALLLWFPHLILKKGYDPGQALVVLAFYAAITGARTFRTPESILLQAARQFRALASASLWSCIVSLSTTFVFFLLFGPVASLAGILIGEVVITFRIFALTRRWIAPHD